jgi:hypothetical protein
VKISWLAKFREWFVVPQDRSAKDIDRSQYERLAIPFSFKPQLSLAEATISAGGAFLRIILGSLLFAVWGTFSYLAWSTIRNIFLRATALVAMLSAFAVSFALLMMGIAALVRMLYPTRHDHPSEPRPDSRQ